MFCKFYITLKKYEVFLLRFSLFVALHFLLFPITLYPADAINPLPEKIIFL